MMIGYVSADCPFVSRDEQKKVLEDAGCRVIFTGSFSKTGSCFLQFVARQKAGMRIAVVQMDCIVSGWRHLRDIIMQVQHKHCTLVSVKEPWINTSAGRGALMLEVLCGLEELEKRFIHQRMSSGRHKAISAGCRMGRPSKLTQQQLEAVAQARAKGHTLREIAQEYDVSISMISRLLKKLPRKS
ncbi:recombinase family protein [Acetobacter oryzifermentans]|uniref:recombinase family protein n=1 Tax=Acetobacter oryzifermentans TaxID=1633874 RepID=UPI0034646C50